jgi:hypothetical protein
MRMVQVSDDEEDETMTVYRTQRTQWNKKPASASPQTTPEPTTPPKATPTNAREDLVKRLEDVMQRSLTEGFGQVTAAIKSLQNQRKPFQSPPPSPSKAGQNRSPRKDKSKGICRKCGEIGHWALECKSQDKKVKFDLNSTEGV